MKTRVRSTWTTSSCAFPAAPAHGCSGLQVRALMSARSHQDGTLQPENAADIPEVLLAQHAQEIAAFGELRAAVAAGVHATAGLRVAGTRTEGELAGEGGDDAISSSDISVTPSIAFDWQPGNANHYYYFRYARAERPGGLAPTTSNEDSTFKADELSSFNLGSRLKLRDATLTIDTALFAGQWRNIQSDYLLSNGIVATHNVGDGDNFGWEATLHWRPEGNWILDVDATLQSARLTHPEIDVADDPRLPVVPDVRLRALLGRTMEWGAWTGIDERRGELHRALATEFRRGAGPQDGGIHHAGTGAGCFATGMVAAVAPGQCDEFTCRHVCVRQPLFGATG